MVCPQGFQGVCKSVVNSAENAKQLLYLVRKVTTMMISCVSQLVTIVLNHVFPDSLSIAAKPAICGLPLPVGTGGSSVGDVLGSDSGIYF